MVWPNGASALDAAKSFEALGALGERLGGVHAFAGAYLRELAAGIWQARLARRNALIVELRERFYRELSNLAAAKAIDRDLRQYSAGPWKRRDAAFAEPPFSYQGTFREGLFLILKAHERPPGVAMIRRILDASRVANARLLHIGNPLLLESSVGARGEAVSDAKNVIEIVKSIPEFRAAAEKAEAKTVADRKRLLEAIAKLDAEATKNYPKRQKREAESIAGLREAERALRVANDAHRAVMFALSQENLAYETARRQAEAPLLEGEWPEIVAFVSFCDEEWERTRQSQTTFSELRRNERTGKSETIQISNGASVVARLKAIVESRRSAWDLRLIADVRDLPQRIEEIKTGWPVVRHPISSAA